jgi:hypothetical protein
MHTSHASHALGVTKNLPHPHQEVTWRTFVDKDTWGACPTMSCTSFTPATIDDATAPVDMALADIVTPAVSAAGQLPSTTEQAGNSCLRQQAPEHTWHSDGGGAALADLMSMYASRSPSPSSSPTHSGLVPQDIDTLIDATTSPTHAADSLEMSQVFNDSNASMPRPMHADFDLLRKLPFSACNFKNRRAQTFDVATATDGVPASHIGQYVVALKDWQPALSQVWVSVAICVCGCPWITGMFGCRVLIQAALGECCHVCCWVRLDNLQVWVPSAPWVPCVCGCVLLINSGSGCARETGRESDCGRHVFLRCHDMSSLLGIHVCCRCACRKRCGLWIGKYSKWAAARMPSKQWIPRLLAA